MEVTAPKRTFDLLAASLLSVLLTPLIFILSVGSAAAFRSWPFFVQERVGLNGKHFRFVKFRSLPATTPPEMDKYELNEVENGRWGTFIRRFHLDELPQLWLVVTGKMSLVGPRPEMPSLSDTFDQDFVAERTTVRPGCTGLWQVSTASAGLIGEAPEFDLHYVRNWTFRMDLWLLGLTIVEILGGVAVKDVGQVPVWTGAALVERIHTCSESGEMSEKMSVPNPKPMIVGHGSSAVAQDSQ